MRHFRKFLVPVRLRCQRDEKGDDYHKEGVSKQQAGYCSCCYDPWMKMMVA